MRTELGIYFSPFALKEIPLGDKGEVGWGMGQSYGGDKSLPLPQPVGGEGWGERAPLDFEARKPAPLPNPFPASGARGLVFHLHTLARENGFFLGWLLLSLALHALLLAWVNAPSHKLLAPSLLINATLHLITPPDSHAVNAAVPQESRAAKAPAISRRLEMPANKPGPVSIAHPAPQEVRPPLSPSEPRPVPEAIEAVRPTSNEATREAATHNPQPDQQQLLGRYAQQLSRLLASHQEYPRLAAMRGWEGEVRLRLRVARKGNLLTLQVDRSSGHDILDQHALQLVDLVRMPPFPDELEGSEIQITVPVNYKLKKAV